MAEAMATMDNEDLSGYISMQYRKNLLPLLKKLKLTEEDSLSPFIRLQEKKKEAQQMQKVLEMKEEAFRVRMEDITSRWKELRAKEDELKAHMKKSQRTLKENDKMRIQALKKAGKEREMKKQKESELLRAKEELEALKNKHQKLSNRVQNYSIFGTYLEDVVNISQFEEIPEIIRHYKKLVRMRKALLQAERGLREAQQQAKELTQYAEDESLQYNSDQDQLELRSHQAHRDILTWESRWADVQKTAAKKTLELGTIKMAILGLFQHVKNQMETSLNVPVDDSYTQLNMIQHFIQDLMDISMEVKRKGIRSH
ncbi:coiled-coil domain-containing protein 42 [Numida meleagris]|uniref:coiled-coil domain-containing protein 42 n=1 Tax=Numida meleagris TaxID=8996 RepID=UPI000B3DE8D2|nr:coiled-coil domain-containing protein 42 [Numida meleagris]